MKTFWQKTKKKVLLAALGLSLIMAGSIWQQRILQVQAAVQVLLVSHTAIPFGTVFPGENLSETYNVQLDTSANSAIYNTTLEPVEGKLNLCPFLQLTPIDAPNEGDTIAASNLTKITDVLDKWQVGFSAPAIAGHVSQDHEGKITVEAGDYECKIIVITQDQKDERRMTGGGSVFMANGDRVTHGFELHCDITNLPNRLEINWEGIGKGKKTDNKFYLEMLTSAVCSDDLNHSAEKPEHAWDTYTGSGTGKLNGVSGATASFVLTDFGEPGKNDMATFTIKDSQGNIILQVSGNLNTGNQQAH